MTFSPEDSMWRTALHSLFLFSLALFPTLAVGQPAPAPDSHERELAQIIRQAGHDCRAIESIELAPSPEAGLESFRPEVAHCTNGKKFLVAKGGRPNTRP